MRLKIKIYKRRRVAFFFYCLKYGKIKLINCSFRRKDMKSEERLSYVLKPMGKEAFFYAYKELAATTKEHILLESGRDGKYSIAGVRPLAKIEALKNEIISDELL